MGTDPSRDEVVLMQILQVLRTLMLAPCGSYLTNESVCEILQSCFRICFETRLSELLRKTSEHTLADMIKMLFSRLPSFKEDSRNNVTLKKLKMKSNRMVSARNKAQKKKLSDPDTPSSSRKSNLKRKEFSSAEDISSRSYIDNMAKISELNQDMGENSDKMDDNSKTDIDSTNAPTTDGHQNDSEPSETVGGNASMKKCVSESDLKDAVEDKEEGAIVSSEKDEAIAEDFAMVDINEDESCGDQSDSASTITGHEMIDYVNPRGIRFTQEVHLYDEETITLIPHGLPCVREVFRFLITLINPFDSHNYEHMIQISLSLLTVAMEVASDSIANFSSLLQLARDELCKHLFSLLHHRRFNLVLPSLRLSFLIFESIRTFVKLQMECYLVRIMELMNSDSVALDIKEKAIDFLVKLFKVPGFAAELYINFDCDLYCSNLFEDLTKLLSKNAFPVSGLQNYHVLSLDALLALIDTVSAHCNARYENKIDSPTHGKIDIPRIKERKKHLETGTDMFNQKPKEGIDYLQRHEFLSTPLDFKEVANHLRENWRLDKKMIGEYISDKRINQLLIEYISTYNFSGVRIDEALRSFLESFRLPGEAPVISYILESFSQQWHESNDRPFANDDAVYILAYAIVMLNTDQHNPQAKKQNIPMSLQNFKSQVRGVNGGKDFDPEMIEEIYLAIRSKEIVLPTEQTGPLKENYVWKILALRSTTGASVPYIPAHDGAYNFDIFTLVWGSTVAALSFVFDKSMDEKTILRSINGFRKCAQIAAFYGSGDVFDNLVISLCKFTTLVNINDDGPDMVPYYFGFNAKAQLAAKTMFQLAHNQGDTLREGWKNIVDCLQNLYKCKLLPNSMVEVEDFVDPSGKISLVKEESVRVIRNDSSGLLSSFYLYFAGADSQSNKGTSVEDQEALQQAKNCIIECKPEHLITESKFLQEESLLELVKALRFASQGPEARLGEGVFEQDLAVFNLELLIQVAIQNRDRIPLIWSQINQHLCNLISESKTCTFLVQRAVVGLIRLCVRLLHNETIASEVIQSLKALLLVEHKVMRIACRQIAFGLHELIKTSAANIHFSSDWQIILALLETAGTGIRFVKCSSPSETETATKPQTAGSKTREIVDMPCLGEFVIKDKEKFGITDIRAFTKSWQSLVLIVQDTAHVTPYNLEPCACILKTFAEALIGKKKRPRVDGGGGKSQKRSSGNTKTRPSNKNSSPESMGMNVLSDDEDESSVFNQVDMISQLLIRIEDLHNRAPKMLKSWAAEESMPNSLPKNFPIWSSCWLSLLQAIGCLCCDHRRDVRMDALGRLQRCLLTHEMLCLTSPEWEECFNVVFLPILHQLLEDINPNDPSGVEETRMRAANTLSKVFLQRLNTLLGLENFLDLWVDILKCMKRYLHADNSELLAEAIPESLKNILLVMQTARLFEYQSQFTIVTWKTLEDFLPNLQSEILSNSPSNIPLPTNLAPAHIDDRQETAPPSQTSTRTPDQSEEAPRTTDETDTNSSDVEHPGVILQPPLPENVSSSGKDQRQSSLSNAHQTYMVAPVVIPSQCGDLPSEEIETRSQPLTAE